MVSTDALVTYSPMMARYRTKIGDRHSSHRCAGLVTFALDHTNTLSEVQGAFIRYNPNHYEIVGAAQLERRLAAPERVRSVNRRVRRRERLILPVGFVKRRDE